jgi:hypothetical protein
VTAAAIPAAIALPTRCPPLPMTLRCPRAATAAAAAFAAVRSPCFPRIFVHT